MISSSFINQNRVDFIQHWFRFFLWGVALAVLGLVAISASTLTTLISIIFLGSLLLVGGIILMIDAFSFWWKKWLGFSFIFFSGLIYALIGYMLISNPVLASASLTLLLGIFYLVVGFFRMAYVLSTRIPNWGWGFFSGLMALILGVFILSSWPQSGLFVIGLFVGIDLFFVGLAYIMTSLAARSLAK